MRKTANFGRGGYIVTGTAVWSSRAKNRKFWPWWVYLRKPREELIYEHEDEAKESIRIRLSVLADAGKSPWTLCTPEELADLIGIPLFAASSAEKKTQPAKDSTGTTDLLNPLKQRMRVIEETMQRIDERIEMSRSANVSELGILKDLPGRVTTIEQTLAKALQPVNPLTSQPALPKQGPLTVRLKQILDDIDRVQASQEHYEQTKREDLIAARLDAFERLLPSEKDRPFGYGDVDPLRDLAEHLARVAKSYSKNYYLKSTKQNRERSEKFSLTVGGYVEQLRMFSLVHGTAADIRS